MNIILFVVAQTTKAPTSRYRQYQKPQQYWPHQYEYYPGSGLGRIGINIFQEEAKPYARAILHNT